MCHPHWSTFTGFMWLKVFLASLSLFFFKPKPGQRKRQRRKPKQRNRKPQSRPKSPNRQNPPKNQKHQNPQRNQRRPRPPRNQKEQPQRSPTPSPRLWGAERRSWPLSWAGTHVRKLENTPERRNAELSIVSGSCLGCFKRIPSAQHDVIGLCLNKWRAGILIKPSTRSLQCFGPWPRRSPGGQSLLNPAWVSHRHNDASRI